MWAVVFIPEDGSKGQIVKRCQTRHEAWRAVREIEMEAIRNGSYVVRPLA